jgi:hypothetical protein
VTTTSPPTQVEPSPTASSTADDSTSPEPSVSP